MLYALSDLCYVDILQLWRYSSGRMVPSQSHQAIVILRSFYSRYKEVVLVLCVVYFSDRVQEGVLRIRAIDRGISDTQSFLSRLDNTSRDNWTDIPSCLSLDSRNLTVTQHTFQVIQTKLRSRYLTGATRLYYSGVRKISESNGASFATRCGQRTWKLRPAKGWPWSESVTCSFFASNSIQ